MNKKVIVGILITVLVFAVVVLSVLLGIALNKDKESGSKSKRYSKYEPLVEEFVEATKDEDKMKKFIDEKTDAKALYVMNQLSLLESEDEQEIKEAFEKYYNNPDADDLKNAEDDVTYTLQSFAYYDLGLKLKEIEHVEPYPYDLGYEDIVASFTDKDNNEVQIIFVCFKDKIAYIYLNNNTDLDLEGKESVSIDFVTHNGVQFAEDYSAFGLTDEQVVDIFSSEYKKTVTLGHNTTIEFNDYISCVVTTSSFGDVAKVDFKAKWVPDQNIEADWEGYISTFVESLNIEDYSSIRDAMVSLHTEMNKHFSYDDEQPFPQELYDEYKIVDHIKIQMKATGISENEMELHFVVTPSAEENR